MKELAELALRWGMPSLALGVVIMMTSPCLALDFSQKLEGMQDGEVLKVGGEDLTLGAVVSRALFSNLPGDEKLSGEDKFARGQLALKVRMAQELDVTAEEVALMKEAVALAYGPLVVARAWALLDPAVKPKPVKTETIPAPKGR